MNGQLSQNNRRINIMTRRQKASMKNKGVDLRTVSPFAVTTSRTVVTAISVTLEVAHSYNADIDFQNLGVLSSETVMKKTGSKSRPTGLYANVVTSGRTDALKKKQFK